MHVQALMMATPPPASDTIFLTGQTPGSTRNDLDISAGFQITVGGSAITVTQLGRWVISGNSQTHALAIYSTGGSVLGSVTVNTSGATASTYIWGTLGTPVVLSASTSYYITSHEASGGDIWLNSNTTVTPTAVASVPNAIFKVDGGNWNTDAGSNNAFVVPNLKYHL